MRLTFTSGSRTRLLVSTLVLLLNTVYLAATASPTMVYFANVVLHMALGLTVLLAGASKSHPDEPSKTRAVLRSRAPAVLLASAAPWLLTAMVP